MDEFNSYLQKEIEELKKNGLFKNERVITSPQKAEITVNSHQVINLCANNYLGLSDHPEVIAAAKQALESYGYGMSSVRFICGTQSIHKELEEKISHFLGTEDTILYSSCFDANTGLFETLFSQEDAIISDSLNHASIIDGIRLTKAARFRYHNNDMDDLEEKLKSAQQSRFRLIATDGVFSMDGIMANLPAICQLANKYNALVMVDDSHAVGFMGKKGKGTPEYHQVTDKIDIITGTLGKALGGASGGYTSGRREVITWLRQKSRPYLFSNSLAPVITAVSSKIINMLEQTDHLREQLHNNSQHFRKGLEELGFNLIPGSHPIIPIMIGDASLSGQMAEKLLEQGVYVISFSYPVVPKGSARIRTQMSASHTTEQLDYALDAFAKVGKDLSLIK